MTAEVRLAWPERTIETQLNIELPFEGDHARLSQLFSNLLGNAISHRMEQAISPSALSRPMTQRACDCRWPTPGRRLRPQRWKNFQPFQRDAKRPAQGGLGLGQYISSQIALAHGGSLNVTSYH
ncbi:ATP-binding protein [Caballeronia sp. LZ001]|uniref:ATP-binding protein n=1 Tax=Caballeronia sp. LZ001 TaxID=3038553 RepID=UPI0038D4041E